MWAKGMQPAAGGNTVSRSIAGEDKGEGEGDARQPVTSIFTSGRREEALPSIPTPFHYTTPFRSNPGLVGRGSCQAPINPNLRPYAILQEGGIEANDLSNFQRA